MSLGWAITDIIKASNALCFWLNRTWKILQTPKQCSILMSSGCVFLCAYYLRCTRVYTYRRGLRCCLFRVEGNSRALLSGTAIVQSRFFVVLKSGTQSQTTAFYIPVYQQLKTQYGTLTTME